MNSSVFESREKHNPMFQKGKKDLTFRDDASIDIEIQQIETEMNRLLTKLESLKLEKLRIKENNAKQSVDPKQAFLHKIQESTTQGRGVSLCPSEIYSTSKSRQPASKADVSSSRRQSCFWKMGEIDELKVTKERGSGGSFSPKRLRKPLTKLEEDTMKKKVMVKKNDVVLSSVQQPNKLFRDVASRYIGKQSGISMMSSSMDGMESGKVKKRWEIPAKGEVVVYKSERESTPVIDEIADDVLKKIKSVRCVTANQRGSKLADLVTKKA